MTLWCFHSFPKKIHWAAYLLYESLHGSTIRFLQLVETINSIESGCGYRNGFSVQGIHWLQKRRHFWKKNNLQHERLHWKENDRGPLKATKVLLSPIKNELDSDGVSPRRTINGSIRRVWFVFRTTCEESVLFEFYRILIVRCRTRRRREWTGRQWRRDGWPSIKPFLSIQSPCFLVTTSWCCMRFLSVIFSCFRLLTAYLVDYLRFLMNELKMSCVNSQPARFGRLYLVLKTVYETIYLYLDGP